jgi:integrase
MSVERRKTSGFWYSVVQIRGKRLVRRLDAPVRGEPGSREFEASRTAAQAEERALKAQVSAGGAAYHRRVADALEAEAAAQAGQFGKTPFADSDGVWKAWLRRKGVSDAWAGISLARLRKFAAWAIRHGAANVEDVTEAQAAAYLRELHKGKAMPGTFNSTRTLLSSLYGPHGVSQRAGWNPFAGVARKPNQGRAVHRIPYSRAELEKLIAACDRSIVGPVTAAACTGLRCADACLLEWAKVDLAGGFLRDMRIRKTGAVLDIPILPMLRREIEKAKGTRGGSRGGKTEGRGAGGEGEGVKRISNVQCPISNVQRKARGRYVWPGAARMALGTSDGLNWRMRKALKRAGLERLAERNGSGIRRANVRGWHSLKTTFITEALNNGMPMEILRKIVGNSTLEVVREHYYQPDKARLAEEMRRAMGEFGA